jgi:hypothetical protein
VEVIAEVAGQGGADDIDFEFDGRCIIRAVLSVFGFPAAAHGLLVVPLAEVAAALSGR